MESPCQHCKHPHPPLVDCKEALLNAIRTLLSRIGTVDTCDCGAPIYWVRHASGRKAPYTREGLLHFVDCTGKFAQRTEQPPRRTETAAGTVGRTPA